MNSFADQMTPGQMAQLALALCATAETLGQTLSADAAELMAGDLAAYSPSQVASALTACRRELKGRLTLAEILERINSGDGRVGKDEAWAIALQADDEARTVVLTAEIMSALQVARPLLEARDKVGARMAFISTYDRLVDEARKAGTPSKWFVSVGSDAQMRARAIKEAIAMKRLPASEGAQHLQMLTHEQPTGNGIAIAGLLTGSVGRPSEDVRQRLNELRAQLAKNKKAMEAGK